MRKNYIFIAFALLCVHVALAQEHKIINQKVILIDSLWVSYATSQCLVPTKDSGYLAAAICSVKGKGIKGKIIKFNKNNSISWAKYYTSSVLGYVSSVIKTYNDQYALLVSEVSDNLLTIIDNEGTVMHKYPYLKEDTNGFNVIKSVSQTSDSGFIINGDWESYGVVPKFYSWIIKMDNKGNINWQRKFEYEKPYTIWVKNISLTPDGNYLVSGQISDTLMAYYGCILKLDKDGKTLWQKQYDYNGKGCWFTKSLVMSDSGFLLTGVANYINRDDYWLVRVSKTGNVIWQKKYGGSYWDKVSTLIQMPDSNFMLFGKTHSRDGDITYNHSKTLITSDIWALKVDKYGNKIWDKCYGGGADEYDVYIAHLNSGSYVILGKAYSEDGDLTNICDRSTYSQDGRTWIIKIKGTDSTSDIEENINNKSIYIYPNPTTTTLTLQVPSATKDYYISITDMSGREILQTRITDVTDNKVDVSSLNSGVYFIKATGSSRVFHAKFVKV